MRTSTLMALVAVVAVLVTSCQSPTSDTQLPRRATKAELNQDAQAALERLYVLMPASTTLMPTAKAVMVFPRVLKAGLVIGGQFGNGVLYSGGKVAGYYNTTAGSYGLQIGAQGFGYALFFMSDEALEYLKKSEGWEIGVGPSLVVVDEGVAKTLTTTTAKRDIYAFIFDQKGLMAGIGIQGSKITPIDPEP
jgi:lipid-binding SYLF domain-containing protein